PKRKNWRKHDARQGIRGLDIGIENSCQNRPPGEPEPDDKAAKRTGGKSKKCFEGCDPQVKPNAAASKIAPCAIEYLERRREEKWVQDRFLRRRYRRQHVPGAKKQDRNKDLQGNDFKPRHSVRSSSARCSLRSWSS